MAKNIKFNKFIEGATDWWGTLTKLHLQHIGKNAPKIFSKDSKFIDRFRAVRQCLISAVSLVVTAPLATLNRPEKRWKELRNFFRRGKKQDEPTQPKKDNGKKQDDLTQPKKNNGKKQDDLTQPKKNNGKKQDLTPQQEAELHDRFYAEKTKSSIQLSSKPKKPRSLLSRLVGKRRISSEMIRK